MPRTKIAQRLAASDRRRAAALYAMTVGLLLAAVAGPSLAPFDPFASDVVNALQAPSSLHWLGTDQVGRDVWSRVLVATRLDLLMAVGAVAASFGVGSTIGAVSGLQGGRVDAVVGRTVDLLMAFPLFVVAMALVAVWGASAWSLVWATAIINLPFYVRLARAEVASRRNASYVWAARLGGAGPVRLLLSTLLPNAMPALVVQAATNLGWVVLNAAGLSFLGLGVRPPTAEWGAMIGEGGPFLLTGQWWMVAGPSLALFVTVWTFLLWGDRLRDRMDPRRERGSATSGPAATSRSSASNGPEPLAIAEHEHEHEHRHEHEHEDHVDRSPSTGSSLLSVDSLSIDVTGEFGTARVVDSVSFQIAAGETFGLVGESGSGKTMTALALCGLLGPAARVVAGQVTFAGHDLARCGEREWRQLRGRHVAIVFQSARRSLHPLRPIGRQLIDVLQARAPLGRASARAQAVALLEEVGLDDAAVRLQARTSQLSGGQCQRVMIALALAGRPSLLIADEPTSALDAGSRDQVVALLARLARTRGLACLFITHDLALAAAHADRIAVMQAGRIVETAAAKALVLRPVHARTQALWRATPQRARTIGDLRPASSRRADGDHGEHDHDHDHDHDDLDPPGTALLEVEALCKAHVAASPAAWRRVRPRSAWRPAVDAATFRIERGEAVGLTGPSGCGKSALAGLVARIADADSGSIRLDGRDIARTPARHAASAPWRRRVQMVLQDPLDSLDARRTAFEAIADPLRRLCGLDGRPLAARVAAIAEQMLLPDDLLGRLPHQLSGGQGARVAIARAMAVAPDLLILDEPTSSLDTTTQAAVLTLLDDVRREFGTSLLLVSHDADVVRLMCSRVLCMENGRLLA